MKHRSSGTEENAAGGRCACNCDEVPGGGWFPVGGAGGFTAPGGAEILFVRTTFVVNEVGTMVSRTDVKGVFAVGVT